MRRAIIGPLGCSIKTKRTFPNTLSPAESERNVFVRSFLEVICNLQDCCFCPFQTHAGSAAELHKGHSGKTIDLFVWLEQYQRGEVHPARTKLGFICHVAYRNELSESITQTTSKVTRSRYRVPRAPNMHSQRLIVVSASADECNGEDSLLFLCRD